MKYFLYLLVSIFSFYSAISQNEIDEPSSLSKSYENYFKTPRESIYLHLNKSSYLRGEDIWFQGYAYDRKTQNLNPDTRNVEVGVYDNTGKILDQKLFLAINGLFTGQITIDSTYADGNYYLKAQTNYMKNFKENYAHIQRFEVLGEGQTEENIRVKDYDLQILPEGGQIIFDRKATLGLKLINQNGLGENFDAELLENEKPIIKFSSNRFGHAKVEFTPKENNNYTIKASLANNKIITEPINDIQQHGFVLRINNILPKRTIIDVSASPPSVQTYESIEAKLMVHQEGKYFDIPLLFSANDMQLVKSVDKEQLFKGLNTITLIVNNKPVAERLIFNRTGLLDNPEDIDISILPNTSKDTIGLKLNMPGFEKNSNLSISVLPKNTISYVKNQNISSSFLLDPFVNGYIEDKTYYFHNSNKRVDYDLDLLLMIQGWSKYEWDNIMNDAPKMNYPRYEGIAQSITLKGRVRSKIDKLLVYGMIYNKNKILDVNDEKEFRLENRYPLKGERMELSYITNKKEFLEPDLTIKTLVNFDATNLNSDQFTPSISSLRNEKLNLNNKELYSSFLRGELLDEVTIKTRVKEEKENYALNFKDNTAIVDENFVNIYPTLADYLSTKGFIVIDAGSNFSIRTASRVSLSGSNSPAIFLNGILLRDLNILSRSRTSDYKEIYVDRTGYGAGVQGAAGVIRLKQRTDALFTGDDNGTDEATYFSYEIEEGFEAPKLFYTPEYSFFETKAFQQIGVLGWFPDVALKADESAELNVFDTGLEDMTFFIEGIAEDGSLINITKSINLKELENDGIKLSTLQTYYRYFDDSRESLYLHLNKNSFLKGEYLWFQGYAYERQSQTLNSETRNVEIGLYNDQGKMIHKKLYLAQDGLFEGQIKIDSTFTDETYFLKAETQYMNNFKEDYSHIQKFEVINSQVDDMSDQFTEQSNIVEQRPDEPLTNRQKQYDLQILPEGGQMVMNAKNRLAFKLLNQDGLGEMFYAKILENEIQLTEFNSNKFGHASSDFTPKANKNYTVEVFLQDGKSIKEPIENIQAYGYVLRADIADNGDALVEISAHLNRISNYEKQKVRLLVHQEGKEFQIPLKFSADQRELLKTINNDELYYGVNTLTLFVNDRPVAERLIFNHRQSLNHESDVEIVKRDSAVSDSLKLNLSIPKLNTLSKLSISVLPERTLSNEKNQNIISSLLLEPFVNGHIENKNYYFKEHSKKTSQDLDLLLMTQGWSRYKWDDIFNERVKITNKRLDGLNQTISFNTKVPNTAEKLILFKTKYNKEDVFPLVQKSIIKLQNRYPIKNEKMDFSVVNKRQKFSQADVKVTTDIKLSTDEIDINKLMFNNSFTVKDKPKFNITEYYNVFTEGEVLDEVIVEADSQPKDPKRVNGITVKVDVDLATKYPTLKEYLMSQGFDFEDRTDNSNFNFFGALKPLVIINGLPGRTYLLKTLPETRSFKEIFIDKSGYLARVYGSPANSAISLKFSNEKLFIPQYDLPYSRVEVENGFEASKDFYMPEYVFFETESFQEVGTIGWFSNVTVNPGETVELQIYDTGLKKLRMFIEGIAEDGSLINIEKTFKQ